MKTTKTVFVLLAALSLTVLLSGCANWEKRYQALSVEHENVQGLLENCRESMENCNSERSQLAGQLNQKQDQISQLQQRITELKQSPGQATGFGDKYDVNVDAAAGTITVTLPNTILFASGKASLKNTTQSDLSHIVSVLKQRYSSRTIDVVGHTDSDPIRKSDWKDNWELSAQRALSVLRYLDSHGIADEHLRAVGCGPARPVASNSTAAGKAKNRRVEIVVHMR